MNQKTDNPLSYLEKGYLKKALFPEHFSCESNAGYARNTHLVLLFSHLAHL
jgi:hypothetical protein